MVFHLENTGAAGGQSQIVPCRENGCPDLNQYRYKSVELETNGNFSILDILVNESPMINSAACLYRTSVIKKMAGFDTRLERHEDIDLSKRVFLSGHDLCSTKNTKAFVIFHGEGWSDFYKRSFADGFYKIDYFK